MPFDAHVDVVRVSGRRALPGGNVEREDGSFASLAFDTNLTALQFCQFPADEQTQSASTVLNVSARAGLGEANEKQLLLLWTETAASVANSKVNIHLVSYAPFFFSHCILVLFPRWEVSDRGIRSLAGLVNRRGDGDDDRAFVLGPREFDSIRGQIDENL